MFKTLRNPFYLIKIIKQNASQNYCTKHTSNQLVRYETHGPVSIVSLNRPAKRNAINRQMATELLDAIDQFERDDMAKVCVLYGNGGSFSAGHDMKEPIDDDDDDPTSLLNMELRTMFVKPMVCGISGYCVGNGLELAMFCDLRVIEEDACLGFFNRRFGVPLSQAGASRLVALIGLSRALDLLMTGRFVSAKEAFDYGLANRIVAPGTALGQAVNLAQCLAKFPQATLRYDRRNAYAFGLGIGGDGGHVVADDGVMNDMKLGLKIFANGLGRAGKTQNIKEKTMADWEMAEYNIEAKVKREKAESDAGKM